MFVATAAVEINAQGFGVPSSDVALLHVRCWREARTVDADHVEGGGNS
jgi:hypothetical protein